MTRITPAPHGRPETRAPRHPADDSVVRSARRIGVTVTEHDVGVGRPARLGARLSVWLEAAVRLGGPSWFERPLVTRLDVSTGRGVAHTAVPTIG